MAQAIGCDYAQKIGNSHTPSTVLSVTNVTNVTALQGCNGCNGCNARAKRKEERAKKNLSSFIFYLLSLNFELFSFILVANKIFFVILQNGNKTLKL